MLRDALSPAADPNRCHLGPLGASGPLRLSVLRKCPSEVGAIRYGLGKITDVDCRDARPAEGRGIDASLPKEIRYSRDEMDAFEEQLRKGAPS